MNEIDDYWPDDLLENIPETPKQILGRHASYLGPKTKNLVLAKVRTSIDDDGDFVHDFMIIVPSFNNYRYVLFSLYHNTSLYPVRELNGTSLLENPADLDIYIKDKVRSRETVAIIKSLLAQVLQVPIIRERK